MAIVSLMMPLSLCVLVPVLTGRLKIRDRYGHGVLKTGNFKYFRGVATRRSLYNDMQFFIGSHLNSTLGAFMLLVAVVCNMVMAFRTETWVLYVTGILGALVRAVISDTKSYLTVS